MRNLLFIASFFIISFSSYAGPGHDHGESAFADNVGPATHFSLTDQQIKNLGITSEKAVLLPITETVDMLTFTEFLPEKLAKVSPRFKGKLLSIKVKVGQKVRKGQHIATLQPVGVGNNNVALYAPISGFVLNIQSTVGEIVDVTNTLIEIGDASQMLVRGIMYETPDITKIKVGQKAEIHLDITPERHILGRIQRINKTIDPVTRTFSAYAIIDTKGMNIQAGLQGTMEIFTGNYDPVLSVPKRAVLGELGSYFVYVIENKKIERRDVTLGTRTGHHIEVTSGLSRDEHVVTNGNYQLQYISVDATKQSGEEEHNHKDGAEHHDHDHADEEHNHKDGSEHHDHDH